MAWPVLLDAIGLYRGDSRQLSFEFHSPPPAWAPNTAYVAGTVGSGTYVAGSTVTFGGQYYTCTTAHTSGATFDKTAWTADGDAVGAGADLSGLGTLVAAAARQGPDKDVVLTLNTSASDLAAGVVAVTIAPGDWDPMAEYSQLSFDVEVSDAPRTMVTTVVRGSFVITQDFTHAAYGI